ncbi:MAG: stage III sporulation protein AE [Firmicutes bacterium]|nr:stage III sporulation protein AE [Bacillota bacterium]MCL1944930.1 stage III sporulation protein AE [Bacillota bacterium]MCL1954260.1 stage III sporulation protein AE [Bacillota bacterium]
MFKRKSKTQKPIKLHTFKSYYLDKHNLVLLYKKGRGVNVEYARFKFVLFLAIGFFVVAILLSTMATTGHAADNDLPLNIGDDMSQSVDDLLNGLDLSHLEDILKQMTEQQRNLFGGSSFLERIRATINGSIGIDFGSFVDFIFYLLGVSVVGFLPLLAMMIAISLTYNIMSQIKGKFASESTDRIIYFACVSAITVLLLTTTGMMIVEVSQTIGTVRSLATSVFPILLTVMTGIGATSSAAVYQPSVAIFSVTLIELVTLVAVPVFIMSFVFNIVGNLSPNIKLDHLGKFFNSGANWLMGTMFFLFLAFLSLQGVTASVFDGISIRTAKFAISRYIPIIGGYLSEGFNLVMAGGVLIKNAVGLSTIILLFASVLPLIINLVAFSLILKFGAAIIQPMGDSNIPNILSGVGKQVSIMAVVVVALLFLFFIFLLLIISTGNLMI